MRDRIKGIHGRLREQYDFLRKSVGDFYRGDIAEALRIATVIRVLVHESGSSKPLLKQIASNYLDLPILNKKLRNDSIISIPIGFRITQQEGCTPNLDLTSPGYQLDTLGNWWTLDCVRMPPLANPISISRKKLILLLANKDGGTHVDLEISERYKALLEGDVPSSILAGTEGNMNPVHLVRCMAGQSGAELMDCIERNLSEVLAEAQNSDKKGFFAVDTSMPNTGQG